MWRLLYEAQEFLANSKLVNSLAAKTAQYLPKYLPAPLGIVFIYTVGFAAISWTTAKAKSRGEFTWALMSLGFLLVAITATVVDVATAGASAWKWGRPVGWCLLGWVACFVASVIAAERHSRIPPGHP